MWAAQLDRPHIFVRPLDSIFLYNHPLLETKLCPNCVLLGASTCISIAADRSDVATAEHREMVPRGPLTFCVHSCSETADNFWPADHFGSSIIMIYMKFVNNVTFRVVTV